jgi:hypothetical protein
MDFEISSSTPISRSFFFQWKANLLLLTLPWSHQLTNGIEDHLELRIVFLPNSLSRRSKFALVASICRNRTKALIISMFTLMALGLLRTLDNMATPSSVKAYGGYRRPSLPARAFEVTNCDLKKANSLLLNWNMKSVCDHLCFFFSA